MKPKTSQPINRYQFSWPKPKIIKPQTNTPKIGINGTNGTLNGLGVFGLVFLIMITPTDTKIKANKVPILHKSVSIVRFKNKAGTATTNPVKIVE